MKKILFFLCLAFASGAAYAAEDVFLKGKILKIDLDDAVAERGGMSYGFSLSGLSTNSAVSLLDFERALKKAAGDKRIAMIYINTDHFKAGAANAEEIRKYIKAFSDSGKPVVAYGASLDNSSYYMASVADRVFLHPQGGGTLSGMSSTQPFLKDLLDTLGIQVQLIRHGKYKSAGEMYIRNDISPENREQYETMMGSIWATIVEEIAESRGIKVEDLNNWVNNLALSTAETWLEKGLVDGLKYRDEMEDYLCHLFGTTDPETVRSIGIKDYISELKKGTSKNKIAVLYANGDIVRSGSGIVGESLAHEIAKVRKDSSIKAVVFRVNSPGGEVVAADMIRREIELLGKVKPVIASYGAYAASGGYLISAGCSRIFVDNNTLTGSIGVFGMVPSFGGAIKKHLHVNMVNVGTHEHSGMGSGMQPLSKEEEAWYQQEIEGIYDTFVKVVADGRSMTKEAVDEIAQGRVWAGRDALKIGLADERATLLEAIEYTAGKAGLKNYRIVSYPERKSIMAQFKSGDKDKDAPLVQLQDMLRPGLNAMAVMPYISIDPVKTFAK